MKLKDAVEYAVGAFIAIGTAYIIIWILFDVMPAVIPQWIESLSRILGV